MKYHLKGNLMKRFVRPSKLSGAAWLAALLCVWFLDSHIGAQEPSKATVEARYPGLASGLLGSAGLESMDNAVLLVADGIKINRAELTGMIEKQEPKLRRQLEKNLFFLLEQEATTRILLREAEKAGVSAKDGDKSRALQTFFDRKSAAVSVSSDEARAFYQANKEAVGSSPFEQVEGEIRQYLLQNKKQEVVASYIASLKDSLHIRVNEKWVESQSRLAMDNVVDKARNTKKPTMVEFGATGCVPCDMMQPILDKLRKKYPARLNVVFVHVGEEQVLAARYGIRSIPVQVFFNTAGKEVFRHVGFFPEDEVEKKLAQIGIGK